MQKQLLTLSFFLLLSTMGWSQLNMTLRSNIEYNTDLNDIWGYVAPDGSEYALVGARNGVSIVNVSDPDNAEEVAFIPGQNSTWRDLKTWGEYAYVVTDQSGSTEGVTVIDLQNLPESVNFFHWTPDLPGLGTLNRCHNIYIDEFGYAYLAGCNINDGGMLFIDVFSTPGTPIFAGAAPNRYAHDVYVRDNKMYSSELTRGRMAIYDVLDKDEVILEGVQTTPFEFTHNIWLSDDSNIAFTTDEQPNAPVAAYDVSDPTDIQELDQYRPTITLGDGVIPHNVHVWQDWLIISYYSDGGIVVDAARPNNLVEVANFDTFFGGGAGFQGVWGAYPFLPSGVVLLTDIGNGLYVMDVNYVRACYLEGTVTDAVSGAQISGAEIVLVAEEANVNYSRLDGTYGTGIATAGTYTVEVSKPGYLPFTAEVSIDNGVLTILDVPLQPLPTYNKNGLVVEEEVIIPVPGAKIILQNDFSVFEFTADGNGVFLIEGVYEDNYDVFVGAWGYEQKLISDLPIVNNDDLVIELGRGYEDDFAIDLGWATTEDNETRAGYWELGEPNGTYSGGSTSNPEFDIEGDIGDQCYVTGNGGGNAATDDVDGASVTLTSPIMALASTYVDPVVAYNLWFFNAGGDGNPDDQLEVIVSNGTEEAVIETLSTSESFWRERSQITLSEFITVTDEMQIRFVTSDFDPNGHLVEAAVDAFAVTGELLVNTDDLVLNVDWSVAPNPFKSEVVLNYQLPVWNGNGQLTVVNALGQTVATQSLSAQQASVTLGANWPRGVYTIKMEVPGQGTAIQRVVKQ
ncbi:choice-of-anchor B family protein [Lewinella cohaerens]|uniref:choice-of-anchor B family protein n=1 Tax=Lewinella cohaerens TaxID=70995 RepID=UPI000377B238|nr:choice-of-anchor B family protein [Lewinella cohaerens]